MNKRFLILSILLCGLIFSACGKENENSNTYTLNDFYNPKGYGYPMNCEGITEEEMAITF